MRLSLSLRRRLVGHLARIGAGPAILAGTMTLFVAGPAAADRVFAPLASELLAGIRNANVAKIPATSGYGTPTIAIRAFAKNEPPVPAEVANTWNHRLLAELHRQARGQFEFVDMSAIATLIRTIQASSDSGAEKADRIADLKANIRADILVSGAITLSRETPVLTYQALGVENGRLLSTSTPTRIQWPEPEPEQPVRIASSDLPDLPVAAFPRGFRPMVAETERRLAQLGYDPGPVDGVMTVHTRRALRSYQADSALPVNGRMTRQTVENMRRDTR
jgi:peptidoglycan hydrolase-like protein with peptidoglycan-binding domain